MNIRYKINIYERDVKYKVHSTENKLPKSLLVNNEKKYKNLTIFEPKHHLGGCYGTDAMPLNQTATFLHLYQVSKVGFKGQSYMFGLYFFSTQK